MNKKYNELLNSVIDILIEKKDYFVGNINDVANIIEYHDFYENHNLTKGDIETINIDRDYIIAIYQLIQDLEELRK